MLRSVMVFVFSGAGAGGRVHGSDVRGTCRPLQVHCGMHPQGMPEKVRKAWGSHHMLKASSILAQKKERKGNKN